MVEPVSLNRARKAKAKSQAKAQAASNRVKFGRTGAQKAAETREREQAAADLEAHRRDEE